MKKFKLGPIQKKWLASLEKHPERQMKGCLGTRNENGTYKACCLGEGGLIAGVCIFNKKNELVTRSGDYSVLSRSDFKALGLRNPTGNNKDNSLCLAELNDDDLDWQMIAAIIRSEPEDFFIKSV